MLEVHTETTWFGLCLFHCTRDQNAIRNGLYMLHLYIIRVWLLCESICSWDTCWDIFKEAVISQTVIIFYFKEYWLQRDKNIIKKSTLFFLFTQISRDSARAKFIDRMIRLNTNRTIPFLADNVSKKLFFVNSNERTFEWGDLVCFFFVDRLLQQVGHFTFMLWRSDQIAEPKYSSCNCKLFEMLLSMRFCFTSLARE